MALFGRGVTPEQKAYLEAMLILAMADGDLEDSEISDMIVNCIQHPALSGLSDKAILNSLNDSYRKMQRQGNDKRISEMAHVLTTTQQRMDALGVALSVSMADGTIEPQELVLLKQMQRAFGLTDAQVQQAMDKYR
ncbi:MAG: tellurite resistance TerB family protein [bacterium]|nr:tellurite resistance TerB family protein [bacterium]